MCFVKLDRGPKRLSICTQRRGRELYISSFASYIGLPNSVPVKTFSKRNIYQCHDLDSSKSLKLASYLKPLLVSLSGYRHAWKRMNLPELCTAYLRLCSWMCQINFPWLKFNMLRLIMHGSRLTWLGFLVFLRPDLGLHLGCRVKVQVNSRSLPCARSCPTHPPFQFLCIPCSVHPSPHLISCTAVFQPCANGKLRYVPIALEPSLSADGARCTPRPRCSFTVTVSADADCS